MFVKEAFAIHGLDWHQHVEIDANQLRPTDIAWSCGDPAKAFRMLGWQANTKFHAVIGKMNSELLETNLHQDVS